MVHGPRQVSAVAGAWGGEEKRGEEGGRNRTLNDRWIHSFDCLDHGHARREPGLKLGETPGGGRRSYAIRSTVLLHHRGSGGVVITTTTTPAAAAAAAAPAPATVAAIAAVRPARLLSHIQLWTSEVFKAASANLPGNFLNE